MDDPIDGTTPLSEEERDHLIPTHISTHEQLNEWEQLNILEADQWAFSRRRADVLSIDFLRKLHTRMFDRTWRWAGQFRTTAKIIGVPVDQIWTSLEDVCGDATYWRDEEVFPAPETAARFHHRLVFVHSFPNGNGRHARLAADTLLQSLGKERLTWGGGSLEPEGSIRSRYIAALREADAGEYDPLFAFLRIGRTS